MNLAHEMTRWAATARDVSGLVMIGSRQHGGANTLSSADQFSDWDFQVITRSPGSYAKSGWPGFTTLGRPQVQVCRRGILGQADKVTAIWPSAEADFVIISAHRLRLARLAIWLGWHRSHPGVRAALASLAVVIRPGHEFLLGADAWAGFYRRVLAEVADPRLDDAQTRTLADGFVCDYLWVQKKIARGELLAAQRMLHASLMETNFRLQHELRLRRGLTSLPDVRRAEMFLSGGELAGLSVSSAPNPTQLTEALAKVASTLRALMAELHVSEWTWPL